MVEPFYPVQPKHQARFHRFHSVAKRAELERPTGRPLQGARHTAALTLRWSRFAPPGRPRDNAASVSPCVQGPRNSRREVWRMRPTTRGEVLSGIIQGASLAHRQEIAAGRSPAQLAVMGWLAGGRPSRTSREPGRPPGKLFPDFGKEFQGKGKQIQAFSFRELGLFNRLQQVWPETATPKPDDPRGPLAVPQGDASLPPGPKAAPGSALPARQNEFQAGVNEFQTGLNEFQAQAERNPSWTERNPNPFSSLRSSLINELSTTQVTTLERRGREPRGSAKPATSKRGAVIASGPRIKSGGEADPGERRARLMFSWIDTPPKPV